MIEQGPEATARRTSMLLVRREASLRPSLGSRARSIARSLSRTAPTCTGNNGRWAMPEIPRRQD